MRHIGACHRHIWGFKVGFFVLKVSSLSIGIHEKLKSC